MMFRCNFIANPIDFNDSSINTLCVENKNLFRNFIRAFRYEQYEENDIELLEDYEQLKCKSSILFVPDFYDLSFSSTVLKKIYDNMAAFCVSDLQSQTINIKCDIISYIDLLLNSYDYDFSYNDDFSMQDIFKALTIKPIINNENMVLSLLDYLILADKYLKPKLFVLQNLHLFYSSIELEQLFNDLKKYDINLLLIESNQDFIASDLEKITIIDNDFCVIVDN